MGTNELIVVYDACVLYPVSLRDFLIRLGMAKLCAPKWSEDIQDEWTNSLLTSGRNFEKSRLERTALLMNKAIPDALISRSRYVDLLPTFKLPDPNDRHVLAAAIVCRAEYIVTCNLKDFPKSVLDKYQIEAIHPDEFVSNFLASSEEAIIDCLNDQQSNLKNPPISLDDLINILKKSGLHKSMDDIVTSLKDV